MPERTNHVWSYDFVAAMTRDGRGLRLLTLIDYQPKCLLRLTIARDLMVAGWSWSRPRRLREPVYHDGRYRRDHAFELGRILYLSLRASFCRKAAIAPVTNS